MPIQDPQLVELDYTNWRGERGRRLVRPKRLYFGQTDFHPDAQWLLDAFDVDKGAERTFAMADVHSWTPVLSD